MRLILIRRCETERNAALRYTSQFEVPINEQGRAQARRVAARLAVVGAAGLYTSDIARAAETAAVIGQALGLAPQPMPELREIDVGHWEGLTPEELFRRYPDQMREFARDPARAVRQGGESYAGLQERARQALDLLYAAHKTDAAVLAVTHGGTIRAMLSHAIGLDLARFPRLWIDPGSLTELRPSPHGWRLTRLNDTAHLEG